MENINARPTLLKQVNLAMIRNVIRIKGTVTRSEIAEQTQISSTTIRSLLNELLLKGELESIGFDESSGGRKAQRYRFRLDCYYSVAFCITATQIHALLINVLGKIIDKITWDITERELESVIITYLDELMKHKKIKSIGIGVPGIVEGGSYWKKRIPEDALYRVDIGETLSKRYHIPVILENDLNATAIGFQRCYEKEFPCENPNNTNMVYLHFEKGCISAGIISEGRIIRGYKNYAGELSLIPLDNDKILDEYLADLKDNAQYIHLVIKIIGWLCGILNPQYIVLGGPDMQKEFISDISDRLYSLLPKHMMTEILYSSDSLHDYYDGMTYLTAEKMFDEIPLLKE